MYKEFGILEICSSRADVQVYFWFGGRRVLFRYRAMSVVDHGCAVFVVPESVGVAVGISRLARWRRTQDLSPAVHCERDFNFDDYFIATAAKCTMHT